MERCIEMSCKLIIFNLKVGRCLFTGIYPWVFLSMQKRPWCPHDGIEPLTKEYDLSKSIFETHRRLMIL